MKDSSILLIHRKRSSRSAKIILIFLILLAVTFIIGMNSGSVRLSPLEVFETLIGNGTKKQNIVLFHLRLPRMIISILAGAGFAVSGAVLQSISRNGLSEPGILGINDGAGLMVLLIAFMAPSPETANPFFLPFVALVGATGSAALIYTLSYKKGHGLIPTRLILVGIAVGAGLSAVSIILTLRLSPENYDFVLQWSMGNLYGANWAYVLALLPWSCILLSFAYSKSHALNLLSMDDNIGTGLGLAIEKEKRLLLAVSIGLSASSVAIAGSIGFVGLIGPHLARRLVGPKHQYMLPVAALTGGLLVLAGDTIARSVMQYSELPAGLIITFLGAPYFLYLLIKS